MARKNPWPELRWWDSGERQVCEEKIDDLERAGIRCNPSRNLLYEALRATPEDIVKVCIVGQDPYPTAAHATGVAFEVPDGVPYTNFPQTLRVLFSEYSSDLGYALPRSGNLRRWTAQGVLLWNAFPSTQSGRPLSNDWDEWSYLTGEIIDRLARKGIVFAFLGAVARKYADKIPEENNRIIITSHPSPRGIMNSRTPFAGSRLFSTINAKLNELKLGTIDWELKNAPEGSNKDVPSNQSKVPPTGVDGSKVLPNITGADLGGLSRNGEKNLRSR